MLLQLMITKYLMQPGKIAPWISLFIQILEQPVQPELSVQPQSLEHAEHLNKQPMWKLKGIVSMITRKLFEK